jgi:hypothetical protein
MKWTLIVLMMLISVVSVNAMVYTVEYSRFVSSVDKSSCNPMTDTNCKIYRDYLEVNYFDDGRFFDDTGTKTGFLANAGASSYQTQVYFKYFDDAFYAPIMTNITTDCIIWHNIYEVTGDINFTTAFTYTFVFGGGNYETLQKFNLKGGESLQCTTDAWYNNSADRRLTMPQRTDVFDASYEIQDEQACSQEVASAQASTAVCRADIASDTSGANPSAQLYIKKLVYYVDYGLNIFYIIIKIGLTIGVIFLLFSVGFILYKVIKREMK